MLQVLIISGTAREGNYSQYVADFIHQHASKHPEIHAELVSPSTINLSIDSEGTQAAKDYPSLTEKIKQADGFIIVAPEYNHGYPGSLKYSLDLHLQEYNHKVVSFVGVSAGPFGGTRVIESLLPVVRELGLVATSIDLNITNVQHELENGQFRDYQTWEKRADKMISEFVWLAQALQIARNQK